VLLIILAEQNEKVQVSDTTMLKKEKKPVPKETGF
jgi:hypothetical protein